MLTQSAARRIVWPWLASLFVLVPLLQTVASAADPTFVGVIALTTDPVIAKQLGLSEDVQARLRALIDRREDQALEIVQQNRDLPPSQQVARLVPFMEESERLGFQLLTLSQRERLQQLRVARTGMLALREDNLARSLGLTNEQRATVNELLEQRSRDLARGGEGEQRIIRALYERRLVGVLDDQQRGTWEKLAGLSDAASPEPRTPAAEPDPFVDDQRGLPAPGDWDAASRDRNDRDMADFDAADLDAADLDAADLDAADLDVADLDAADLDVADLDVADWDGDEWPIDGADLGDSVADDLDLADREPADPDAAAWEDELAETLRPAEVTPERRLPVTPDRLPGQEAPLRPERVVDDRLAGEDRIPDRAVEPRAPVVDDGKIRFSFYATPWREVLEWFADRADLSLVVEVLPVGSFTYRDERAYSVDEALDVMNSYLLTRGYTLVRRQRLLLVIDLESPIPDELVTLVTLEELGERGRYELVKCVFPLARMQADEARSMVQPYLGPHGSVIAFPAARQILVTETAGKLRTIRDLIERVENPESAGLDRIIDITLEHVMAEEALMIVRPLLGLDQDQNSNQQISISVDPLGMRLFATGEQEQLQLLKDMIRRIDRESAALAGELEAPEELTLQTYFVRAADPQLVLRITQTLLANLPGVRLEVDTTSGKLVALARSSEHALIAETIRQLEGQSQRFEVLQLQRSDPQLVVMAINKFFNLSTDPENRRPDDPVVDGDPLSMKLWVRGTESQLEQIRDLVDKLEGSAEEREAGSMVRVFPLYGPAAHSALETVEQLWGRENRIRMVTPSALTPSNVRLRAVTPLDEDEEAAEITLPLAPSATSPAMPAAREVRPAGRVDVEAERWLPRTPSRPLVPTAPADRPVGERSISDPDRASRPSSGEPDWEAPWELRFVSQPAVSTEAAPLEAAPLEAAPLETPQVETPALRLPSTAGDAASVIRERRPGEAGEQAAAAHEAEEERASDIRVAVTPQGILISSEDPQALEEFEELLRMVTGPGAMAPQRDITVFYLKYAQAEVASSLVQEVMGGAGAAGGGSLLDDVTSNLLGGGLIGGLLGGLGGGGEPTLVQGTGPVTIVPDPRLNALIVEANEADLQFVEDLLRVIDRESSVTDIQTSGVPRLIPILYSSAEEIAGVVRQTFADRIATAGGQQRQPSPEDIIRALRGQGGRGGDRGGDNRGEQQRMTISVDARSNSLVVTAPEPLFRQVEQLVEQIDVPGSPDTDVVVVQPLRHSDPEVVKRALGTIINSTATRRPTTSGQQPQQAAGGGAPTADQMRQRMEFLRSIQQGMQAGGGAGGRGGAPGGGAPTGGGRMGGGRGR